MLTSTDYLRRVIAPTGVQGRVTMSYLCPHCHSFPMEDYVWWVSGEKKAFKLVARDLWRKNYDWKQSNRLLVVQTGESVHQAKVFRAHAVPQGLFGNMINALKLLAKQQEDGDGFTQNIVTNLCDEGADGIYTTRQSSCPGSRRLERRFENFFKNEGRKDQKDIQR